MISCYFELGPLCWVTPGKFWGWLACMVVTWGIIGYILLRPSRRLTPPSDTERQE